MKIKQMLLPMCYDIVASEERDRALGKDMWDWYFLRSFSFVAGLLVDLLLLPLRLLALIVRLIVGRTEI